MPKTKEEYQKEFEKQLLGYYKAGDVGGFLDYMMENEAIVLPSLDTDHPEEARNNAMTEALYAIYDQPDSQKAGKFFVDLTQEVARRKIDEVIKLGDVMEDYEKKIKNGEVPGTEHYANDPNSTEKIAAVLTKGSQAANKVKCIDSASFTIAMSMRNYDSEHTGPSNRFDKAYIEERNKVKSVADYSNDYWKSKGLPEKQYKKLRKRLECNFVDRDYDLDYEAIGYREEGDERLFQDMPDDVKNIKAMSDRQLDDEMKRAVEQADPEVKFYKESEKIGAYLNVWDSITMPAVTGFYDDKTRYAVKDGINEITGSLRNDLYGREGGLMSHSPSYVMDAVNKAILKTDHFISERERLQERRELNVENSEHAKKLAVDEKDMTQKMVFVGKLFKTKLEEMKNRLTAANTPEVQEKADKPFREYIPGKLKAIENNNKKLAMLRTEKQLRSDEKSAHDAMSTNLNDYLSYGGSKDFHGSYYAAKALVESKKLGTSKADEGKKAAINEFVTSLKNTSPAKGTDKNFIIDLGNELNEKELAATERFTQKKNEFKADILAGQVPGVFGADEEMADALASDLVYHTTAEGKELKAVHETKKEVFGAVKESPNWKNYLAHNPDIASSYDVPDYANRAEKYGYKVSDDISRQFGGTKFEKMPQSAQRLMSADKAELEAMVNSTARKSAGADALNLKINDLAEQAGKMLETLNATNKKDHRNSGSYDRMIADLTNVANLKSGKMVNNKGQLVDITAAGVQGLLDDLDRSSKEYQQAHSGLFSGISKGFGRTRYNSSVMLQNFAKSGKKSIENELNFIGPDKSIAKFKNEQEKQIKDIENVSFDKGFGKIVRKDLNSPIEKLDAFIAEAEKQNVNVNGSSEYNVAIAAAKGLKSAMENGDPDFIANQAETTKQCIEAYNNYKREQILNGDMPNDKGWQRIDAMNGLKFGANLASVYAANLKGISGDKTYEHTYKDEMNAQKKDILDNKAREQQNVDQSIVNERTVNKALRDAGVSRKASDNVSRYDSRINDESLKGIDQVSAYAASEAANMLDSYSANSIILDPKNQQNAKQYIAELVLDKMVQLDHGGTLHKIMKNMDRDQFKEVAKDLSESRAFKASVPDKIDGSYVQQFLADHNGHGVMQVKNSIDKYRKAVKNINENVNKAPKQPEPKVQPKALQNNV